MNKLKKEKIYLQDRLFAKLGGQGNITDDEIKALIEEEVLIRSRQVYLAVEDRIQLKKELFNVFRRLDILSGFLEDDDVSDGNTQIEIPLYAVEWLKMGLSETFKIQGYPVG